MNTKIIIGVISVFIAITIIGAVLVPVVSSAGYTTTTITNTISNEGAADIKLTKITSGFELDMTVENDGQALDITIGEDNMTADIAPMFIISTDTAAIFINDNDDVVLIWTENDETEQYIIESNFTVKTTDSYLVVNDGADINLPLPSSYMFIPSSNGIYGSFTEGNLDKIPTDPVIAAGYYADVAAYNANTTLGDKLTETVIATDDTITSVSWNIPSPDDLLFDPDNIQIQPFNPGDIQIQPLDPGTNVMTVPTPTYTDGVWGYELSGTDATIVSYSGTSSDVITIPSTVGGYNVVAVGKGGIDEPIFNTSLTDYTVVISDGITTINKSAFRSDKFTFITIPDSVTSIGGMAFYGCNKLTSIVIPDTVITFSGDGTFSSCTGLTSIQLPSGMTSIPSSMFMSCNHLQNITIPENVTSIGAGAFSGCSALTHIIIPGGITTISSSSPLPFNNSGIQQVLNLSQVEITTTSYGLNADSVQDHIDAMIYLAPYNYTSTEIIKTPNQWADLYNVLPIIVIVGLMAATIAMFLISRRE